ncbi:(Fe-S)-binding protein [Paenibacillus sp. ACRRX]|uniref:(Fe-S)-binding protein n=1 Tax=Paenibacillus sp. ACRRX TaxID=2918206 RepID=UPI001EF52C2C|nr:(Fe-S)-binding protein [Paenibacillus sp. ACRRX]
MSTHDDNLAMGRSVENKLQVKLVKALDYEELMNCMRCGFCQPSCPTYQLTGLEAASPRGRIALMKAVADGVMEPDAAFKQQLDLCLGCRACEPVCPSDVKYGQLLEQAKDALFEHSAEAGQEQRMRLIHRFMKPVFKNHTRLRRMSGLLQTYQRTGLQRIIRKSRLLRWLPPQVQMMERVMPFADNAGVVKRVGGTHVAAKGKKIGTVGLFRGCVMDVVFTDTNVNTVRLLAESGYDVIIPEEQACCGALFAHSGDRDTAKELAKQNMSVFKIAGVDFIASNAGGCGSMLVEYAHLFDREPEWKEAAMGFAAQVKDVAELLLRSNHWTGGLSQRNMPLHAGVTLRDAAFRTAAIQSRDSTCHETVDTITYQDSCHLRNVMRGSDGPRQLLRLLPNINFKEFEGAEMCCGSAGIYNLVQPDMANAIIDGKMQAIEEIKATVILTSNPGCLLQMKIGVEREQANDRIKVMHVVDYFAEKVLK